MQRIAHAAACISGPSLLPNGTTAVTQLAGNGTELVATDAYVDNAIAVATENLLSNIPLMNATILTSFDEAATSWPGTLAGGAYIDTVDNWLILSNTGGIVNTPGVYTCPDSHILSLSEIKTVRLSVAYTSAKYPIYRSIADVPDFGALSSVGAVGVGALDTIADVLDFASLPSVAAVGVPGVFVATGLPSVIIQVSISQDGTTWSTWATFTGGQYTGKAFKFRLILTSNNINMTVVVSALTCTASIDTFNGIVNNEYDTVAGTATTSPIWVAMGNILNFTGTPTVTSFPGAPQAGTSRILICAGACAFTAGANMLIQGYTSGQTYTAAAGDIVTVLAITSTQFKIIIDRYNGKPTGTLISSDVGLGNVTNDAQLKRATGDFASFPSKSTPIGADILLIEDSTASNAKKQILISSLPLSGLISIMNYGGDNTGTSDNTAAFAATIAACPTGYACVYFPPGRYRFSSAVTYALPNITGASISILGSGSEVTQLYWPSGQGMQFDYVGSSNTVTVRGMSLLTGANGVGSALCLHNSFTGMTDSPNTISDVTIRGADGYSGTNYWAYGFNNWGISVVNLTNFAAWGSGGNAGVGAIIQGTSSDIAVQINFATPSFMGLDKGIYYGAYVQGVTVTNGNFTGDTFGIYTNTANQGDQLAVSTSQFGCNAYAVFEEDNGGVNDNLFSNNLIIVATSGNGLVFGVNGQGRNAITGNSILHPGGDQSGNGLIINNSQGVIVGNHFQGFTTAVWLGAGSYGYNVQSNGYYNNGTNVLNQGSSNTVGGGSP